MTPRPVPVGPGPQEKRRPFHLVVRLGIPDRAVERAVLPVLFTQQSSPRQLQGYRWGDASHAWRGGQSPRRAAQLLKTFIYQRRSHRVVSKKNNRHFRACSPQIPSLVFGTFIATSSGPETLCHPPQHRLKLGEG
jgi:hypothetical protein